MDLLYFFFLGIIFTHMSLDYNHVFESKNLEINKDEKASVFKVLFDILTAWFIAGNALFFLYLSVSFIRKGISISSKFVEIIIVLVILINLFIMPFLLFKRILKRDKNKQ